MAETSQVLARRWLQFRLRTLLLAPVFILLLQVFSDQLFDHLIALWCAYGAMFGAAWAIGRMRIVGPRRTGLARVLPVAKAAIEGGMIGGALLGAPVLWTALWRSGAWRYFNTQSVASDAWEIFTSGVAGYWSGGFAGALAGGAVGTLAAYSICLLARGFGVQAWSQGSAGKEATEHAGAIETRSWRLHCRRALMVALATCPPIWLAACLWGDRNEQITVDRLRMGGGLNLNREPYGPHWFESDVATGYELEWFRRVKAVYNYGRIERQAFDDLSRLTHMRQIYFELDSDADVIATAAWLRRRPDVQAAIELNGTRITDDGLSAFSGLGNISELFINNTTIGDASVDTIESLTSLKRLIARGRLNISAEAQQRLPLLSIVPPLSPPRKR